jgi:Domain of unknown function (DUF4190)/Protein of unknown function (DUF1559)
MRCKCGNEFPVPEPAPERIECPVCHRAFTLKKKGSTAPARRRARDESERTSRKAIWSLGLGIASFVFALFTAIPAIILGIKALNEIGCSRGRVRGSGLALAGLITGAIGTVVVAVVLLMPALQKARDDEGRPASAYNLKVLALAMHNYHDIYGAFPAAGGGKGQHADLSWRVTILPFLAAAEDSIPRGHRTSRRPPVQNDDAAGGGVLYEKFHRTEPWDSPHNKTLLEAMPHLFEMPFAHDPPGMTRYRVFVGPHAAFDMPFRGRRMSEFTQADGTTNTILIIEAAAAVPWTKPEELEFAEGRPLPKLSTLYVTCAAAMADGSVRIFPPGMPESKLRAMITIDGGENVEWP